MQMFICLLLSLFISVSQSCPTICNPVDCSTPGFPAHHQLPEFTQIHIHRAGWSHPTISLSFIPFSSCLQSFPISESFPVSQFFASDGQRIGASASVFPMNIQDWFPLRLTGLISFQFKGLFKSLLQHHSSKASVLWCSAFFIVQFSHPYMTTGKTIALTMQTLSAKYHLCFLLC